MGVPALFSASSGFNTYEHTPAAIRIQAGTHLSVSFTNKRVLLMSSQFWLVPRRRARREWPSSGGRTSCVDWSEVSSGTAGATAAV